MAFDYGKLRGRIIEKYGSQSAFASEYRKKYQGGGVSEHTISVKLSGKCFFSQKDIIRFSEMLSIDSIDIPKYFFALSVQ